METFYALQQLQNPVGLKIIIQNTGLTFSLSAN